MIMKKALYFLIAAMIIGLCKGIYDMELAISLGESRQSVMFGGIPMFIIFAVGILLLSKLIGQLNEPISDSGTDNEYGEKIMQTSITQKMSDLLDYKNPLRQFYDKRKEAVDKSLESSELAALMMEKFGEGLVSLLEPESHAQQITDGYCEMLDPNYKATRKARYVSVAKLDLEEKR
jgi:hypothetical protein